MCDIGRHVVRPALGGVEAHNPNRVFELSLKHVHDDRFEVCPLNVGFPVRATDRAEIVHDDVGGVIVFVWDD